MTKRSKLEIVDQKGNPVRVYKDASCTIPYEGIGIVFLDKDGHIPRVYLCADGEQPFKKES